MSVERKSHTAATVLPVPTDRKDGEMNYDKSCRELGTYDEIGNFWLTEPLNIDQSKISALQAAFACISGEAVGGVLTKTSELFLIGECEDDLVAGLVRKNFDPRQFATAYRPTSLTITVELA